jgi:hypothetical protein
MRPHLILLRHVGNGQADACAIVFAAPALPVLQEAAAAAAAVRLSPLQLSCTSLLPGPGTAPSSGLSSSRPSLLMKPHTTPCLKDLHAAAAAAAGVMQQDQHHHQQHQGLYRMMLG